MTGHRHSRTRGRFTLALAAVLAGVLLTAAPATAAVPGPPGYPQYWWDEWGIPALWSSGADGTGVTVAVVDSGVAPIAPLRHALTAGTDLTGLGGNGQVDREIDLFSHGTAMASIIAATDAPGGMLGVAPGATVVPIAIPLVGVESTVRSDRTAAAIDYAAAHGADIISMSFGERRKPEATKVPCPEDTQAAIFRAVAKGLLVVAAAGNDGEDGSPVTDPSVCLGVISVAAIDSAHRPASFSSRHRYVTVAAPGVRVLSLNRANDLYVGDGTSQATALVSGALALIWSAHRAESNRQVAARLMAGLRDVAGSGRDVETGYGAVNPLAAARATLSVSSPNPVFAAADPFLRDLQAPTATLPTPAAVSTQAPGHAERDQPPARTSARAIAAGAAVAGLGAALLLILALAGRRRRTAPAHAAPHGPPAPFGPAFWPDPTPGAAIAPGAFGYPGAPFGRGVGPPPAPSPYPDSGPIPGAHPLAVSLGLPAPDPAWTDRSTPSVWPPAPPAPAPPAPAPPASASPEWAAPDPARPEPRWAEGASADPVRWDDPASGPGGAPHD